LVRVTVTRLPIFPYLFRFPLVLRFLCVVLAVFKFIAGHVKLPVFFACLLRPVVKDVHSSVSESQEGSEILALIISVEDLKVRLLLIVRAPVFLFLFFIVTIFRS